MESRPAALLLNGLSGFYGAQRGGTAAGMLDHWLDAEKGFFLLLLLYFFILR